MEIEKEAGELSTDGALTDALNTHSLVVQDVQKLITQRLNQSPNDTQFQHLKKVESNFTTIIKQFDQRAKTSQERIRQRKAKINTDFERNLGFSNEQNEEIRQVFRNKPEDEQHSDIMAAIEAGNGVMLNALLNSNPYTTGLTPEARENYRNLAMKKHAPKDFALMGALDNARKLLGKSAFGLVDITDSITANHIRENYEALEAQAINSQF